MRSNLLRSAMVAAFALVVAACSESSSSPLGMQRVSTDANVMTTTTTVGSGVLDDYTQWYRRIWVCKVGTSADFSVTVNGGAPSTVAMLANECKVVHYMDSTDPLKAAGFPQRMSPVHS